MADEPTYSSTISGKGSLIEETLAVLQEIDQGHSPEQVRAMVIEDDLLGKMTRSTRESVWDNIHSRYLSDGNRASTLARMVVHAPDRQTRSLVLFYEFCRSSPLLSDVTIECVYPRYSAGFTGIDKTIIQQFFDEIATDHPELAEWSPQTRGKVVSNILTILRDFGLLHGAQRKQFSRLYVPLPAFVYVLYRLSDDGIAVARQMIAASDWQLFFLEQGDVIRMLEEATASGHCTFLHRGDIFALDLAYPSLEACVAALTEKV
jgi:hypothetical protein